MTYFICEAQELVAEVDSMDASSLYVSIVVGGKYDSISHPYVWKNVEHRISCYSNR